MCDFFILILCILEAITVEPFFSSFKKKKVKSVECSDCHVKWLFHAMTILDYDAV